MNTTNRPTVACLSSPVHTRAINSRNLFLRKKKCVSKRERELTKLNENRWA